jgi:hypothetical protein
MPRENAQHYRQQAERLRAIAHGEDDLDLKAEILWVVEQYDVLAKTAAKVANTPDTR